VWQIEQDNLIEKKRNSTDSWQKAQRGTVGTLLAEMGYLDTSDEPIRAMGMGLDYSVLDLKTAGSGPIALCVR